MQKLPHADFKQEMTRKLLLVQIGCGLVPEASKRISPSTSTPTRLDLRTSGCLIVELPTFANTEASIPELEERVAKTIEFIEAIKPAQIDGSEDKEITMKFASGERKFSGQSLLLNFCLPNFYFHATTAYERSLCS